MEIQRKEIKEYKFLRVCAYCRVSTNREEQEGSFENQKDVYRRMIETNPSWIFAGIYADRGKSGVSVKSRPGFCKMIDDGENEKYDMILVKSISRFSRNIGDCQRYIERLRNHGVTVFFEREQLYTNDPASDFILSLIGAISQDESRSIGQNVAIAYHERFAQGIYKMGNHRILGYDCDERGNLIQNRSAWIVKEIFESFLSGESYHRIAAKLNEKGAKTLKGNPFSPEAVRYILGNEKYVGDKHLQKSTLRGCNYYLANDHEGLVDRITWEKAQNILEKKRKKDCEK